MDLVNIPKKLVNKFNKNHIKTVEDLQNNYFKLTQSVGFGGIFKATLLDYIDREGIEIPNKDSSPKDEQIQPLVTKELDFDPPPSKLLTKVFERANIYNKDDLRRDYKKIIKSSYFGAKRLDDLISYMETLGIKDIPEIIKKEHQASTSNMFEDIQNGLDKLVQENHTKFIFPFHSALNIAFSKLHIKNLKDLQKKLPALQMLLRKKLTAISELRNSINDTIKFYEVPEENTSKPTSKNLLDNYTAGLSILSNHGSLSKIKFTPKIAAHLIGKDVDGVPRIDFQVIQQLNALKKAVNTSLFISENDALLFFCSDLSQVQPSHRTIIQLICKSLGYKVRDFKRLGEKKGSSIFIAKDTKSIHILNNIVDKVNIQLQSSITPVNAATLFENLNIDKNEELNLKVFTHLLDNLSHIKKANNKYSLTAEKLKSKADIAARILYESQKKMSTTELCDAVNKILKEKGLAQNKENQRTATSFLQNPNVAFNPKNGIWTFKK